MKKKFFVLAIFLSLSFVSHALATTSKYSVYCVNGKIEIDRRNLQSMKSARGGGVYSMAVLGHLSSAKNFAQKFGGVGGKCPRVNSSYNNSNTGHSSINTTKYSVYCANGKIEVDMRDLKSMKSARGIDTYALAVFDHLSTANNFARQMGGVGVKCPKK